MGRPEPQCLHLTTTGRRSGLPREIEIWFTRQGPRYHLIAEHGEQAQWVRNILADPHVSVRVGARRRAGRARLVEDGTALAAAVRQRSERKYGWGNGLVVEVALTPVSGRR